jgi:hypothetical protein
MWAKYVVLNAIFSTMPIASGGSKAHENAARRAHPDTSRSQL